MACGSSSSLLAGDGKVGEDEEGGVGDCEAERKELRDAKQLRIDEAEDRGDQRALRAAKGIRINMDKTEHKEVAFAWVDGVFWQRWIRTTYGIDVKDGERVIINDEDVSFPHIGTALVGCVCRARH